MKVYEGSIKGSTTYRLCKESEVQNRYYYYLEMYSDTLMWHFFHL